MNSVLLNVVDMISFEEIDVLCFLGISPAVMEKVSQYLSWVSAEKKRQLFFLDDQEAEIARLQKFLPCTEQIHFFVIESMLQWARCAKQIAQKAVFLRLKVYAQDQWVSLQKMIEMAHVEENLLLSDCADLGCGVAAHAKQNGLRPLRNGMELRNAFPQVPAIILGAGPSLEKEKEFLSLLQDQALIFAGGSALNHCFVEPHFASSIDMQAPYQQFKQHCFWEVPFCIQSRMNRENGALLHGEVLWFPEGHFSFLNWIAGEERAFDGGWTVSTFLTRIALHMGCNPIILVGIDLCYDKMRKYAGSQESMSTEPVSLLVLEQEGGKHTQPDWLLARCWFENVARSNPHVQIIDAKEGGLALRDPVQKIPLRLIPLQKQEQLKQRVHQAVHKLPFLPQQTTRWQLWEESVRKCKFLVDNSLCAQELEVDLEGEAAYEQLLAPQWKTWRNVVEREVMGHAAEKETVMKLHRLLFFQRTLQEHLDVL